MKSLTKYGQNLQNLKGPNKAKAKTIADLIGEKSEAAGKLAAGFMRANSGIILTQSCMPSSAVRAAGRGVFVLDMERGEWVLPSRVRIRNASIDWFFEGSGGHADSHLQVDRAPTPTPMTEDEWSRVPPNIWHRVTPTGRITDTEPVNDRIRERFEEWYERLIAGPNRPTSRDMRGPT